MVCGAPRRRGRPGAKGSAGVGSCQGPRCAAKRRREPAMPGRSAAVGRWGVPSRRAVAAPRRGLRACPGTPSPRCTATAWRRTRGRGRRRGACAERGRPAGVRAEGPPRQPRRRRAVAPRGTPARCEPAAGRAAAGACPVRYWRPLGPSLTARQGLLGPNRPVEAFRPAPELLRAGPRQALPSQRGMLLLLLRRMPSRQPQQARRLGAQHRRPGSGVSRHRRPCIYENMS